MRILFVLPIILFACSTTQEIKKRSLELNLYKLAKKQKSCSGFKALRKGQNFPLQKLVTIQLLANCDFDKKEFVEVTSKHEIKKDHFLRPHFSRFALSHAMKHLMYKEAIIYAEENIKYLKTKKEKESKAKELLDFIIQSKLPSLINAARDILFDNAPRLIENPTDSQLFKKAKDFERVRKFKKARQFYQKVISNKTLIHRERMKGYYRKAMTYKLARDKQTYSRVLMSMMFWMKREKLDAKAKSDSELYEDIWKYRLLCIRARWTNGLATKSLEQINYYLNTFVKMSSKTKAELLLVRGQIYRERQNYPKANADFKTVTEQELVSKETLEKASWSLAWNYYLTEQFNEAVAAFEKVISQNDNFNEIKRYYYWQARSLEKLKKKEAANERYEKLSNEDSFGYYGILATYHLNKTFPPLSFENYPPNKSSDQVLMWLKALEEDDLVKEYLKQKKIHTNYSDFHFANWYDGGLFHFFKLSDEEKNEVYHYDLPLAYPTPYKEEFQKASSNTGIPASFLYSIARQESAFNTHARSWADAFGLLQVTPEKAKLLSRKYKVPYQTVDDLYTPKTNLPLGSYLLKELMAKTNGEFITVVASYNAGRKPVKSWYKTRFREDPIEFIERIPYKETRTYVKLIFRNYIIYSRLLGEKRKNGIDLLYSTLD